MYGRGQRSIQRIDYRIANLTGFNQLKMGRPKRKKPIKGAVKKKDIAKKKVNESQNKNLGVEPSTSNANPSEFELVEDLHSDMGRGSENSSEPDTSDIDSEELEAQNKELEELDKQIEEKRAKCSKAERRERKERMREMRKVAEEKRRILQGLESDTEVQEPKRRKISKSKNGKGVKNAKKGNKSDRINKENRKDGESSDRRKEKYPQNRKRKNKNNEDNTETASSSSSSPDSSQDEFEEIIENTRKSKTKKKKGKSRIQHKKSFLERKRRNKQQDETSDTTDSSSDSSSTNSSTSEVSSASENERGQERRRSKKRQKKGKTLKSGVRAKAHKIRLKTSELCAQAVLDEEYYPGSHSLESLSFDQLVAGELEICTMLDISRKEKMIRLKILKLLAYFAGIVAQSTIIEVYKAVILKVEKGIFSWSSELVEKMENMLDRAVSKSKISAEIEEQKKEKAVEKNANRENKEKVQKDPGIQLKNGDTIVYCADYNKNKCEKSNPHDGKFMGREVMKYHVCNVCLTADKEKRFHRESEDKCPHKTT